MSEELKLSQQVCFPIYTLAKEVIAMYRPILKDLDLTYPQYLVLLTLWEQDEQSVSEIGDKLNLDSGTLTPLLKRMAQKDLVTRKRSTKDERIVTIGLTPEGKAKKAQAGCVPGQMIEALDVSPKSLQDLKQAVENILTQIKSKHENNL